MIPYARQNITQEDVDAVAAALRAPFLTQGPLIAEFEEALAKSVGAKYAVAFNSGTAALHAAYFAAGVGPGADVVTAPITFVATVNAACYLGADPRLVDVEPETVLLDPERLREVKEGSVKVVCPVHFAGQVANLPVIRGIAESRGWTVIEDAAHALGARYVADGVEYPVGACAHSAMCCFSFHPVKHITTGEGGAVSTNDSSLRDRLMLFRSHGITRNAALMQSYDGPWDYEQQEMGFNYRITDIQCALGLKQLARLGQSVERRRAIAEMYDRIFRDDPNVRPTAVPEYSRGSYHLYVVRVPAHVRRAVFEGLVKEDIRPNVHYAPVYRHPVHRHRGAPGRFPCADAYYAEALTLPMFPDLTDAEVEQVGAAVRKVVKRALETAAA